jgi:hypothetical protein
LFASSTSQDFEAMQLPRLYAILDAACFPNAPAMFAAAEQLTAAGVTLLQYRNKSANARQMLEHAHKLKRLVGSDVKLVMNDRADLALAADFDGLHIGQGDLSPEADRIAGSVSPRTMPSRLPRPTRPTPTTWPSAPSSRPPAKRTPTPCSASTACAGQGN